MKADKENQGVLFRNDRKERDTQPDYKGAINIRGEEFWLNAWINEAKSGQKYMAIRVNPKTEPREKPKLRVVGDTTSNLDDEIPF